MGGGVCKSSGYIAQWRFTNLKLENLRSKKMRPIYKETLVRPIQETLMDKNYKILLNLTFQSTEMQGKC